MLLQDFKKTNYEYLIEMKFKIQIKQLIVNCSFTDPSPNIPGFPQVHRDFVGQLNDSSDRFILLYSH